MKHFYTIIAAYVLGCIFSWHWNMFDWPMPVQLGVGFFLILGFIFPDFTEDDED